MKYLSIFIILFASFTPVNSALALDQTGSSSCRDAAYAKITSEQLDAITSKKNAANITDVRQINPELAALSAVTWEQAALSLIACDQSTKAYNTAMGWMLFATIYARLAAAKTYFDQYTEEMWSMGNSAQSVGANSKQQEINWCNRHKPEAGYLYPDYGRLVTWNDWHPRCDPLGL